MRQYEEKAKQARLKVLEMIWRAQSSHIGSNFSCIDILTVLFEQMDLEKDKLIVSKGWVAAAIYYFLSEKNIIPKEDLERYCMPDEEEYIGLIEPRDKFALEVAGGSMGLGLPTAVGYALAKKLKGEEGKVYCLMSDGEQAIGTTWESALIAAHHQLDNLVVIVDRNGWQAMGRTTDVLALNNLRKKFDIFGWESREVDGHSFQNIERSLTWPRLYRGRPLVIIASTVKGKGVSFMEDDNLWHYWHISDDNYKQAKVELDHSPTLPKGT